MEYGLKGRAALITGGGRGLGRAIAEIFAAEGVRLAIGYHQDQLAAKNACSELAGMYGIETVAVRGNIALEKDVKRIFAQAADTLGGIDILVNNGGVCPVSLIEDMEFGEWKEVMDVNLSGVFLTCREMVRYLIRENKKGSIVNVASQSAFNGSRRGKSHYAASKGGVVSLTVSLAKEVADRGIRVNAVCPGMMYTQMTKAVLDAEEEKYNAQIPLGRIARTDEPARVVAFLASDQAGYMTGSIVDVSGGMMGR